MFAHFSFVISSDHFSIIIVLTFNISSTLVVVTNEVSSDDQYVGYLLDTIEKSDGSYFEIDVFGESVHEYEVDTASFNDLTTDDDDDDNLDTIDEDSIDEESIVVFKMNSDDTIEIIKTSDEANYVNSASEFNSSEFDYDMIVGQVTKVDGDWLEIDTDTGNKDNDEKVKVYSDTLIYETDDEDADIDKYDFVAVAADGTKARVIKRFGITFDKYNTDYDQEATFEDDIEDMSDIGDGTSKPSDNDFNFTGETTTTPTPSEATTYLITDYNTGFDKLYLEDVDSNTTDLLLDSNKTIVDEGGATVTANAANLNMDNWTSTDDWFVDLDGDDITFNDQNFAPVVESATTTQTSATGTVTISGVISDDETLTIGGRVYVFDVADDGDATSTGDVVITTTDGSTDLTTAQADAKAAILYAVGNDGSATVTMGAFSGDDSTVTANTANDGAFGNQLTLAKTGTNLGVSGTDLTGGEDSIDVVFSENVADATIDTADFTTDFGISTVGNEAGTASVTDDTVTLTVTTADSQVLGEDITVTTTEVTDEAGNDVDSANNTATIN